MREMCRNFACNQHCRQNNTETASATLTPATMIGNCNACVLEQIGGAGYGALPAPMKHRWRLSKALSAARSLPIWLSPIAPAGIFIVSEGGRGMNQEELLKSLMELDFIAVDLGLFSEYAPR